MTKVKLKICGMKHNTAEVAALKPDYLGFIFYENSPRNFETAMPMLPETIKKVGVFVNASESFIADTIKLHKLDILQLHGDESSDYCKQLKSSTAKEIWKVVPIGDAFNFNTLKPYAEHVDYYLFDTQSKERGGSGRRFNWGLLGSYPFKKPFILSGGIGFENLAEVKIMLRSGLPIHAIDINSKFEIEPGLKNVELIKQFIDEL
jgi:phosphoribosylanthranilate isomerase